MTQLVVVLAYNNIDVIGWLNLALWNYLSPRIFRSIIKGKWMTDKEKKVYYT
jgi:hypothetical protein